MWRSQDCATFSSCWLHVSPLRGHVCVCVCGRPGAMCLPASSKKSLVTRLKAVPKRCLHWLLIVCSVQLEKTQEPFNSTFVALFVCFCQVCFLCSSQRTRLFPVDANVKSSFELIGGLKAFPRRIHLRKANNKHPMSWSRLNGTVIFTGESHLPPVWVQPTFSQGCDANIFWPN